jgi:hypothetical protein
LLFINCLSITISYPCLQDGGWGGGHWERRG